MLLTIGKLKEIIKDVDDDTLLANMMLADHNRIRTFAPKRILLGKRDDMKYLIFNNMGTHWDEKWEKENNIKVNEYIDIQTHERKNLV